jgi:hypothetical protein
MARFLRARGISTGRLLLFISLVTLWIGETQMLRDAALPTLDPIMDALAVGHFFTQEGWFLTSAFMLCASLLFLLRVQEELAGLLVVFTSIVMGNLHMIVLGDELPLSMTLAMLPLTAVAAWTIGLIAHRRKEPSEREHAAGEFACGAIGAAIFMSGLFKLFDPTHAWTSGVAHGIAILSTIETSHLPWMEDARLLISDHPALCSLATWLVLASQLAGAGLLFPSWRRVIVAFVLAGFLWTELLLDIRAVPATLALLALTWWSLARPPAPKESTLAALP